MKKQVCAQFDILKKIRKKGKVNGYDIELAEAQAKDYIAMKNRLDQIETTVDAVQKKQIEQDTKFDAIRDKQIEQDTKFDLILKRLNSPVEQERKDGIVWNEIRTALKSWKGWALIIFILMSVALAGEKILQLINWIPKGA